MKYEHSYGGVVYKKEDKGIKFVLIRRLSRSKFKKKDVWCLPKGKPKEGETEQETALREVKEETGLLCRIEQKIDTIKYYFFTANKQKCLKQVTFFLMEQTSADTGGHDREVEEVKYFQFQCAIGLMSYPSEVEILKKANSMING
jgi:8-oxo-dGTP pyrophosphatase MutT (NUDIX family)